MHQYCALATLNPVYNSFITAVILLEANCTGLGIHSLALPCILSRVVLAQSFLQTFLFFVEKKIFWFWLAVYTLLIGRICFAEHIAFIAVIALWRCLATAFRASESVHSSTGVWSWYSICSAHCVWTQEAVVELYQWSTSQFHYFFFTQAVLISSGFCQAVCDPMWMRWMCLQTVACMVASRHEQEY